jgi:hypothetical protein
MTNTSLGLVLFRGFHVFHSGHGGTDVVLLLVGLGFAGLLVWAIQRSGKPTT